LNHQKQEIIAKNLFQKQEIIAKNLFLTHWDRISEGKNVGYRNKQYDACMLE